MEERLVVPSWKTFSENEDEFGRSGFTKEIFQDLFPILQVSTWDAYWLFVYGRKMPMNAKILEIGSGRGGSICCLDCGGKNKNLDFVSIDPFLPYEEKRLGKIFTNVKEGDFYDFRKNTEKRRINAENILKKSDDAIDDVRDNDFDLIFIDGNHSHEHVKRDLLNYMNKLKKNGVLLGHDYNPKFDGVIKAVDEVLKNFEILENSNLYSWRNEAL